MMILDFYQILDSIRLITGLELTQRFLESVLRDRYEKKKDNKE